MGAELSPEPRSAAALALPLGVGLALTSTSVQTYINRRVPLTHQGRTFAIQSSLKNGIAIAPLLGLAYALVQASRHFGGDAPRRNLDVTATFWDEPEAETDSSA